ncbi:response regulator [Jiella endophytica]|nr:response regulator [Jiella endophytica]
MANAAKILNAVHIYLLDDDEAVCDALATILELHGAKVQTFSSLSETRNARLDGHPGILLFDVQLLDGLGQDLLVELRGRGVATPAILMSGRAEIDELEPIMEHCEFVLEKPVDGDELATRIAALVAAAPG